MTPGITEDLLHQLTGPIGHPRLIVESGIGCHEYTQSNNSLNAIELAPQVA